MGECTHHFVIDDELSGTCKKCGFEKQFSEVPTPEKLQRRYWEISYESLREAKFKLEEEDGMDDDGPY